MLDAELHVACTECGHQMTTRLGDWPEAVAAGNPDLIVCPGCSAPGTLQATPDPGGHDA